MVALKQSPTTLTDIALDYQQLNTPRDREQLNISVQTEVAHKPLSRSTLGKISIDRAEFIAKFRARVADRCFGETADSRILNDLVQTGYVRELLGLNSGKCDRPQWWAICDVEGEQTGLPLVVDCDPNRSQKVEGKDSSALETVQAVEKDFRFLLETSLEEEVTESEREFFQEILSSTLRLLGDRACEADMQYDGQPSTRKRRSNKLGKALQALAQDPTHLLVPTPPTSSDTTEKPPRRSHTLTRRQRAAHVVLLKLLTNLFARPSTPATDLAIWSNAAKLLALAYQQKHAIVKIGSLLVKHTIKTRPRRVGSDAGGDSDPDDSDDSDDDDDDGGGGGILGYMQRNPKRTAGIVALGVVCAAPVVVLGPLAAALGFGAAGPVAGGIAAGIQSGIGLVEAGGLFAMMQSIGMAGAAATAGAPLLTAVGAAAGVGATALAATGDLGNGGAAGDGGMEVLRTVELIVDIVLMVI